MGTENKTNATSGVNKKRKQRYLSSTKPYKKGSYPLYPGVQGFFITCDGGREKQAANEAINVIENFFEELVEGVECGSKCNSEPSKPVNKITKFSDSSSDDEDETKPQQEQHAEHQNETEKETETPLKKQCVDSTPSKCEDEVSDKNDKPIDELIEAELKVLKDRTKRHFVSLDSGCNGVVFIKMLKKDGEPGPTEIVNHMMASSFSTKKHISRFILRILPVEVSCYASEEEISKAIKPVVDQYFPAEAQTGLKFAVLYDGRANTGIDRMAIINSVAKSIPEPHKVDLTNPDKSIVVQIVKTVCLIGVVERYKEFCKYNLRQLTSPKS